jgi:indoleacetamide hydrolase
MLELGIADLLTSFAVRDFSVTEYANAALEKVQKHQNLNAFISIDEGAVREWARVCDASRAAGHAGPLCGIPLAIKDNIDFCGLPTSAGTPALAGHRPRITAPTLQRLLDQGCGVLGKSNLHELACGATTRNEHFGYARTPYDLSRVAGGSSGGTATAIAARIVPGGLGTDTGASVRAPSSFCGTAALRPTVGYSQSDRRYPTGGVVPISTTRDTIGPMARSVADVAILDSAIMNRPPAAKAELKGIKLALPLKPFWLDLDPAIEAIGWDMVYRLEALGVTFVETTAFEDVNRLNEAASIADLWEFRQALPQYLSEGGTGLGWDDIFNQVVGPEVRALMSVAATVTRQQRDDALSGARKQLVNTYQNFFAESGCDGYLIPAVPILSPKAIDQTGVITDEMAGPRLDEFNLIIRNLYASAGAGVPSVVMPAGLSKTALPVGIEIVGPHGADTRLLSIAMAFEDMTGPLPPPVLEYDHD